jgi:hypothetical protein
MEALGLRIPGFGRELQMAEAATSSAAENSRSSAPLG